MNISIFAAVGSQNLWDELILKNEIALLREEFWKNTKFRVCTYDIKNPFYIDDSVSYIEYFPIDFRRFKNISRNLRNFKNFISTLWWSDRVIIGWGWIIFDSEIQSVSDPLKQWKFRTNWARFLWKKIYFYRVWIDIKREENFLILRKIFKKSWKITVRDQKSKEQLLHIWINSEIIDDPVMQDNILQEDHWKIISSHNSRKFRPSDFAWYDFAWKRVGLALRSGYIWNSQNPKMQQLMIEELCQCIEKAGGKILFLPHSFHKTDLIANDYLFMKQFLNLEREIYADIWEVYTVYNHKMLDCIITMRLHSIILSYIYGIDQIVLSYSQKTDELLKKLK